MIPSGEMRTRFHSASVLVGCVTLCDSMALSEPGGYPGWFPCLFQYRYPLRLHGRSKVKVLG